MVRVRFAPSPTGFLHIGGVRTALSNFLYARGKGGKFLLRIEDTDTERSEERFTKDILEGLRWLGLRHDEELVYQSARMKEYARVVEEWIARGLAYRCTCTEADVEKMRERQMAAGEKPQYDRTCREKGVPADCGVPFAIRAKVPLDGEASFEDLIRGTIAFQNRELDDFVLVRSSGAPTYNFTVVIDDVAMGITHVIRGDDHINNTPKQLHLYRFLGRELPKFAHLPMILGADKKKLSKRNGVVSCNAYRSEGYLPEALLNFLVRLGWSHGDQEFFTMEEMVKHFDFDHVQKAGAVFNPEKLLWLNAEHMKKAEPSRLARIVRDEFAGEWSEAGRAALDGAWGAELAGLHREKTKTLKEMAEWMRPLCEPGLPAVDPSALAWNKDAEKKGAAKKALALVLKGLDAKAAGKARLADAGFGRAELDAFLREAATTGGVKLGDLAQPLRLAVTGRSASADLFEIACRMPWKDARARMEAALGW